MREINKIAEGLFEKIRDRFEEVSLGDQNAKATQDPEKARFFNFDYTVDGHNHGNITMSLIDETSLKIYFSKNISDKLDDEHKKDWYTFLRELREFARRNLLSFEPRDITRSTLKHRDVQQQSKTDDTYSADDVVSEGKMYGTKKRSYESFGPVRIKLKHNKAVVDEVHGSRSRNIESVFIENADLERFKLPFNNLTGARAMARHVSAGGIPTDDIGQHITEMVKEMTTLRPFVRGMARRTFEDSLTKDMVESAFEYHGLLKNTLKKLKGKRGYTAFKENFTPSETQQEVDVSDLKDLFVKKTLDERIEQALPLVHKAHNIMKENNNPFSQQFESWAQRISEGTWQVPESENDIKGLAELLKTPLSVGVDAMDAQSALRPFIGDDQLFNELETLAEEEPNADARAIIIYWLDNNMPDVLTQIKAMTKEDVPTEVAEGKMKDLMTDIDELTDEEFEEKYGTTKPDYPGIEKKVDEADDDYDAQADQDAMDYEADINLGDNDDADESADAVHDAIHRRFINNLDLVIKIGGPKETMDAIEDYVSGQDWSDLQEIGTSDVSAWVNDIVKTYSKDKELSEVRKLSGMKGNSAILESKMKDLALDLDELTNDDFEKKYKMKKSDWEEVKTPGLRQDPSKPAYIGKMKKHSKNIRPSDWAQAMMADDKQMMSEAQFDEAAGEKDACYHKVKSKYKVWPSAYASGALVQCRKKGAKNWGNSK